MTLFEVMQGSGISYTNSDMAYIGQAVKKLATEKGIPVYKKTVQEKGLTIKVTEYPEEFRVDIEKEILKHFSSKLSF